MTMPAILAGSEWRGALAALVFAALSTVGIFSGGADAALVIGLAAVLLVAGIAGRTAPALDRSLALLAALFILLLWAGLLWSIAPQRTMRGALQMTGLLIVALVLTGEREPLWGSADLIFRVALIAAIVGSTLAFLDFVTGHPIMRHVLAHPELPGVLDTKFDRGFTYESVLIWPIVAAGWAAGRRGLAVAALAVLAAALAASHTDAARLAFLVGLAVLALAALAPRLAAAALAAGVALAVATPVFVAAFGRQLIPLANGVKHSFAHRLEIWDYMTARTWERPLLGWGWWSAQALPIQPEELARYLYVSPAGSPHPHNQWLQLWVETGIPGALLGAAFALIVLHRGLKLGRQHRPFALACFAAAMVPSLASFDLAADSWWCTLAATGLLWRLLPAPPERR